MAFVSLVAKMKARNRRTQGVAPKKNSIKRKFRLLQYTVNLMFSKNFAVIYVFFVYIDFRNMSKDEVIDILRLNTFKL
jgi:hypothetical protein